MKEDKENCFREFKMQYRIVHRKNFFIIGFSKRITLQFHGENRQLDSLYALMTDENRKKLMSFNDCEPYGIVSVSADFSDRTREGSIWELHLRGLPPTDLMFFPFLNQSGLYSHHAAAIRKRCRAHGLKSTPHGLPPRIMSSRAVPRCSGMKAMTHRAEISKVRYGYR